MHSIVSTVLTNQLYTKLVHGNVKTAGPMRSELLALSQFKSWDLRLVFQDSPDESCLPVLTRIGIGPAEVVKSFLMVVPPFRESFRTLERERWERGLVV